MTWGMAIGWWDMVIIQYDRHIILQESPFGGYRLNVIIHPDFWNWSSTSWQLDKIIVDIWAEAPGDPTPINALDQYVDWDYTPQGLNCFTMFQPANAPYVSYLRFPGNPPPGYWYERYDRPHPDSFVVPNP